MGKLTVTSFITLDNVVEEPHLWSGAFQSEDTGAYNSEVLREAGHGIELAGPEAGGCLTGCSSKRHRSGPGPEQPGRSRFDSSWKTSFPKCSNSVIAMITVNSELTSNR